MGFLQIFNSTKGITTIHSEVFGLNGLDAAGVVRTQNLVVG